MTVRFVQTCTSCGQKLQHVSHWTIFSLNFVPLFDDDDVGCDAMHLQRNLTTLIVVGLRCKCIVLLKLFEKSTRHNMIVMLCRVILLKNFRKFNRNAHRSEARRPGKRRE